MKKYIKRIWFTVFCFIVLPLEIWPAIWNGEHDHERWDFWYH